MIIELVGLPGAGKTTLAHKLRGKGATVVGTSSRIRLFGAAALFFCTHPMLSLGMAYGILRNAPRGMRYSLYVNGFMVSAAKWYMARRVSKKGGVAVIDQGHAHLVVSLLALPAWIIHSFPKPDVLSIVEAPALLRYERMAARGRTPRDDAGAASVEVWDEKAGRALSEAMLLFETVYPAVVHVDGTLDLEQTAAELISRRGRPKKAGCFAHSIRRTGKMLGYALAAFITYVLHPKKPSVVILMYHSVDAADWKHSIPPKEFAWQIRYIATHYTVVPLSDVVAHARGIKPCTRNSVAITFDDGYRDLITHALPILEAYEAPATLFLTTDLSVSTSSVDLPRITDEEVQELVEGGRISVESHGRGHSHFPQLSNTQVQSELKDSRNDILQRYGIHAQFFAYPFGARTDAAEAMVSEEGYAAAFSITEGLIHERDNLFRLKRVQVDVSMNRFLFRIRLTHALDTYRKMKVWFTETHRA